MNVIETQRQKVDYFLTTLKHLYRNIEEHIEIVLKQNKELALPAAAMFHGEQKEALKQRNLLLSKNGVKKKENNS